MNRPTAAASTTRTPRPGAARPSVPPAAKWLGILGVIPFVCLSGVSVLTTDVIAAHALFALAGYGAVILSFLGGVHWGLAIAGSDGHDNDGALSRRLTMSVVPSLVGWGALLLPAASGLLVMAASFAAMLVIDWRASLKSEAPAWYPSLRWPLTLVVVCALVAAVLV